MSWFSRKPVAKQEGLVPNVISLPMSPTTERKKGTASVNIHHTGEQILLHVLNTKD